MPPREVDAGEGGDSRPDEHGHAERVLGQLGIALADAMFVLSGGQVETCRAEPAAADGQLALEPSAEVGWLLTEASRRMRVLASSRAWSSTTVTGWRPRPARSSREWSSGMAGTRSWPPPTAAVPRAT